MRTVVIAGGPDISIEFLSNSVTAKDYVICADSGVDYAIESGIIPSRVVGDLDSISDDGRQFIEHRRIPVEVFPIEKDMTDAELALRSVPVSDEILFVCSLTGRIDHVTANLNLAVKLHSEGYAITVTDGYSYCLPMVDSETIELSELSNSNMSVSLIPYDLEVKGVTTSGLYYELNDATLLWGTTLPISNKLKPNETKIKISIKSGKLGVFITPTE